MLIAHIGVVLHSVADRFVPVAGLGEIGPIRFLLLGRRRRCKAGGHE